MKLNAVLRYKENEIRSQYCVVEKVLELTESEYARLYQSPLQEQDFIVEHQDLMYQDKDGIRHCLLVLGKNQEDGILIDADGYPYARYHALIPKARQLYLMEQYPSLAESNRQMTEQVAQTVQKAVADQQDGMYRVLLDDLGMEKWEEQLFIGMLKDRPEFAYLEVMDDELFLKLNLEYVREKKELPRLKQEDVDILCAKHVLWLHDAGGAQADFSGCDLSGLDLSHRELNSAIFAGARMYETNLARSELCFSDFTDATLFVCDMRGITAEESSFKDAVADDCDLRGAFFTHSNFSGALIQSCRIERSDWTNCCVDGTEFPQTPKEQANMKNISEDEQDWSQNSGPVLST